MIITRSCFRPSHLINTIRSSFDRSLEEIKRNRVYSTTDCLMSGLAMFHLKYPSLLQFDEACRDSAKAKNIKNLYKTKNVPSDTTMRERLDPLEVDIVNQAIHDVIKVVQRSQSLQDWDFLGTKLISLDGSGFFSSDTIHCSNCCEKHLKNQAVIYYHQMLVGAIVRPGKKEVLPVLFEPICKEDGDKKNDCERNAAKRWLKKYRSLYPNMPTTIVEDGLASNGPHIKALQEARCHFILGAKEDDHKFLYQQFWNNEGAEFTEITPKYKRRYRFMNNVSLNEANADLKVNVLYFEEEELPMPNKKKPKKKLAPKREWVWVTDYHLTEENVRNIAEGGRARWKIENETFNTLKNQGYHFEHNYGHGYKNLSNVLAGVMLLAFLVDQILMACNKEVQQALKAMCGRPSYLWAKLRSLFDEWMANNLESLYQAVFQPPPRATLADAGF